MKNKKNMGIIKVQKVQILKVLLEGGLPYRQVMSLLQFHSNPSIIEQNEKKEIKKNKNFKIKRKNKICPFFSKVKQ